MGDRIFNVRTDVNASDCARGCTDTVRKSALKVDSGRKILCRTGESNLRRWRAGPTLYQLSYIPTPTVLESDLKKGGGRGNSSVVTKDCNGNGKLTV